MGLHFTIAGTKLLMSMGWRPGQGIGPRLSRRQRNQRQSSHARLFGPMLPDRKKDSDDDDDDDDEFRFVLSILHVL